MKSRFKALFSIVFASVLAILVAATDARALTLDPVAFGSTRNFGAGQAFPGSTMQIFKFTFAEDRNNMEFDIGALTGPVSSAQLFIPIFATSSSLGQLIDLRSYSGNGTIEFADFSAGSTDFTFAANTIPASVTLDVTAILNVLIGSSASHIGFTGAFANLASVPFNAGLSFTDLSPGNTQIPQLEIELGTTVVPLPAALPLFAGGLGLLGLVGWRRRRKGTAGF